MFVLSILYMVVQECYWTANSVITILMNSVCNLMFVCFPIDFQHGVNDFDVGVNESILFDLFLYPEWHIYNECPKVLLNVD